MFFVLPRLGSTWKLFFVADIIGMSSILKLFSETRPTMNVNSTAAKLPQPSFHYEI